MTYIPPKMSSMTVFVAVTLKLASTFCQSVAVGTYKLRIISYLIAQQDYSCATKKIETHIFHMAVR